MLKAYINYPEPHVTAYFYPGCGKIQSQNKEDQRYYIINIENLSANLKKFIALVLNHTTICGLKLISRITHSN